LTLEDGEGASRAVSDLADAITDKQHHSTDFRRSLCAASKMLVVAGLPLPIWDSLALKAHKKKGKQIKTYYELHKEWTEGYAACQKDYASAYEASAGTRLLFSKDESNIFPTDEMAKTYFSVRAHDMHVMAKGASAS
jgi:hypothetical protein